MKTITEKPRLVVVTDENERGAIMAKKYLDGHPHWAISKGLLYVLADELRDWRATKAEANPHD